MRDGRKRTPWFNAMIHPPVNGERGAVYEHQCETSPVTFWTKGTLCSDEVCPGCRWRGLAEKPE